jgi:RNA polymerase sigma-70 factor, ECF subfamily
MTAPVFKANRSKGRRTSSENVVHPVQFQADDETLIRSMKAGQSHAFRTFYRRHVSRVYAVLLRTLGDDTDLDILIQEVFTKAFQNIHTLKHPAQVRSWLAAIAVHTARDTIKHRRRHRRLLFFEPSALPEPLPVTDDTGDREAVRAVYRLLDKLGVDARIAFTLRYIQEMELTEVAEACGVSLATVKRRLARAKRQFYASAKADPALREWVARRVAPSVCEVDDD